MGLRKVVDWMAVADFAVRVTEIKVPCTLEK